MAGRKHSTSLRPLANPRAAQPRASGAAAVRTPPSAVASVLWPGKTESPTRHRPEFFVKLNDGLGSTEQQRFALDVR